MNVIYKKVFEKLNGSYKQNGFNDDDVTKMFDSYFYEILDCFDLYFDDYAGWNL